MTTMRPHIATRVVLQLGLLALVIIAAVNYQQILNRFALVTFHPSADVAAIEQHIDLTTDARGILYRAQPRIDDKSTFNAACNTQPHELELGCNYRGRIYVFRFDNDRLAPEMQVVTAHELLHAAWAQMGPDERARLTKLLEAAYARLADPDLRQRMANYAQTEPGEEANELHSILGTEYSDVGPELEKHYQQFFVNRQVVVAAHIQYKSVFDTRRQELEQQLATIRSEKARLAVMNQQMAALRSSGQIDRYNSMVPAQNRLVDDINQKISTYSQGVDEYNALSKSLDSQVITDTEPSAQ